MNDSKEWDTYIPPPFDPTAYQARIDQVAGVAPNGRPVLWLRWTHDCRNPERFGAAPFTYGVKDGKHRPFIPPRWVLQQRNEPEQYWASWEATRHQEDEDGNPRDAGPPPSEFYAHLCTIADHDAWCCLYAEKQLRQNCFGQYKAPDDELLQQIAKAAAERDYIDPRAPMSDADHRRILAEAASTVAAREEKVKAENKRITYEFARDYGHKLLGEDHGKAYGFAPTKSGLLVPESALDANANSTSGSAPL